MRRGRQTILCKLACIPISLGMVLDCSSCTRHITLLGKEQLRKPFPANIQQYPANSNSQDKRKIGCDWRGFQLSGLALNFNHLSIILLIILSIMVSITLLTIFSVILTKMANY